MTARTENIALLGEPILRQIAQTVSPNAMHLAIQTADTLMATLDGTDGVGLAAPQIFNASRIIVVASKPTKRYPNAPHIDPIMMINPSFSPLSDVCEKGWEGCLSIPGIRANVPRYQHIAIQYSNLAGQCVQQELSGFVARVFQHEYDHLEGIVYLDRIDTNQDIISEAVFLKTQLKTQ